MTQRESYLNYIETFGAQCASAAQMKSCQESARVKYPYKLELEERFPNGARKMKAVFSDGSEIPAFEYLPARNYQNEKDWAKKQYRRYQVQLKPDEARALEKILEEKNINFTEWVRSNIH